MKRVFGIALAVVLFLAPVGCATLDEIENPNSGQEMGDLGDGFSNPGAREGKLSMDRELCWQSITPDEPTDESAQAAYRECMEEKGWSL